MSRSRFIAANGLLPGYIVPPGPGETVEVTTEFAQLSRQVDSLMELVKGNGVGVAA